METFCSPPSVCPVATAFFVVVVVVLTFAEAVGFLSAAPAYGAVFCFSCRSCGGACYFADCYLGDWCFGGEDRLVVFCDAFIYF